MRAIVILLFLLSLLLFSLTVKSVNYEDYVKGKTCSETWGASCNLTTTNDTFNGTECPPSSGSENCYVEEIYLNASAVFPGNGINVTCKFHGLIESHCGIFYYNTSSWVTLYYGNCENIDQNISIEFIPNQTEGMHIIRCSISLVEFGNQFCANSTPFDNDDINFTVVVPLEFNFWNLTNYTTGEIIESLVFNRTDQSGNTIYLNASANWSKPLNYSVIEHNGTGTFKNYTICSKETNPCEELWTNYTLNLSDATQFNRKTIALRIIASDYSGVWGFNSTPYLTFNLDPGLEPEIFGYSFSSQKANLHSNLTICANVSDDVGIFALKANITYPNNESVIIENFVGDPNPGNQTWCFSFDEEKITLNETGNYTLNWIKVFDTGDQEANISLISNFAVFNNLNLKAFIFPENPYPNSNYSLTISILDINDNPHQFPVNLTVECEGYYFELLNINKTTTTSFCKSPNEWGKNFYIKINASDAYNNSAQQTFSFKTHSLLSPPSGGGGILPPICLPQSDYEINCSDGKDNDCDGATDCADPDCSKYPDCIPKIPSFNFTISQNEIEIIQGMNATIIGSIFNLGNIDLNLEPEIYAEKNCCSIIILSNLTLPEKASIDFPILIHVYSFTEVGEYLVDLKIKFESLENLRSIKVKVVENKIISYILNSLDLELQKLNEELNDFERVGIDILYLRRKVEEIKVLKMEAIKAIQKDDFNFIVEMYRSIKSNIDYVNSEKEKLGFKKFLYENKWNISLQFCVAAFSIYIIGYVIIPFAKLSAEIAKLSFEEKSLVQSRIAAEKQYFLRKIDEQTFRKIIEGKQAQILKVRASLALKKKQRIELIKKRLNPFYALKGSKEIKQEK